MAEPSKPLRDIAGMSFEDALAELEGIVRQLEEGKGRLDEAIAAYARGSELKAYCEIKLREAQAKVDRIVVTAERLVRTEPADIA